MTHLGVRGDINRTLDRSLLMFNDNKYTKWYNNIIRAAKKSSRDDKTQIYEKHHIIPKSFGGSNKKDNIVLLTLKEHFICHLLLTKMCDGVYKQKMFWALHRMSFSRNRVNKGSASYALARKKFIKNLRENHPAKIDPESFSKKMKNAALMQWKNNDVRKKEASKRMSSLHEKRKTEDENSYYETQLLNAKLGAASTAKKWETDKEWAEEQKDKMSARVSGNKNPMYGKKIEGEHLEKLSQATSRKRWICNEDETLYVDKDLIEGYFKIGYKPGRKNYKRKESR
jgi:hypothetical protein